jgi:hypothetical protein
LMLTIEHSTQYRLMLTIEHSTLSTSICNG